MRLHGRGPREFLLETGPLVEASRHPCEAGTGTPEAICLVWWCHHETGSITWVWSPQAHPLATEGRPVSICLSWPARRQLV